MILSQVLSRDDSHDPTEREKSLKTRPKASETGGILRFWPIFRWN